MFHHATGTFGDPIYVRQVPTDSGIGLIALPLLLVSLWEAGRQAAADAEREEARWRALRRRERERRRAARREWECWVLEEKRKWRAYVKDCEAQGRPEPRYREAAGSKYGIELPGYPSEVVEFAEQEAERGVYHGECVAYGQLWQWELRPETIRRVRRMVHEAVRPGIPQTVLDDAFTMFKAGATSGTIKYTGQVYRWQKTGPNKLKFIDVRGVDHELDANDDADLVGNRGRGGLKAVLILAAIVIAAGAVKVALMVWDRAHELNRTDTPANQVADTSDRPAPPAGLPRVEEEEEPAHAATRPAVKAGPIAGKWEGVDADGDRQAVLLDKDGSFSAGVVRNGRYQYTMFGRYEYATDTLVVTFRNGKSEWGKVEWVDPDSFRYKITESTNKGSAVGRTIEYTRVK